MGVGAVVYVWAVVGGRAEQDAPVVQWFRSDPLYTTGSDCFWETQVQFQEGALSISNYSFFFFCLR